MGASAGSGEALRPEPLPVMSPPPPLAMGTPVEHMGSHGVHVRRRFKHCLPKYGCNRPVPYVYVCAHGRRANIMCPGLTHKNVVEELAANPIDDNTPVCILAEVGSLYHRHFFFIGKKRRASEDA